MQETKPKKSLQIIALSPLQSYWDCVFLTSFAKLCVSWIKKGRKNSIVWSKNTVEKVSLSCRCKNGWTVSHHINNTYSTIIIILRFSLFNITACCSDPYLLFCSFSNFTACCPDLLLLLWWHLFYIHTACIFVEWLSPLSVVLVKSIVLT